MTSLDTLIRFFDLSTALLYRVFEFKILHSFLKAFAYEVLICCKISETGIKRPKAKIYKSSRLFILEILLQIWLDFIAAKGLFFESTVVSQLDTTCLRFAIETLEQDVKYVQS